MKRVCWLGLTHNRSSWETGSLGSTYKGLQQWIAKRANPPVCGGSSGQTWKQLPRLRISGGCKLCRPAMYLLLIEHVVHGCWGWELPTVLYEGIKWKGEKQEEKEDGVRGVEYQRKEKVVFKNRDRGDDRLERKLHILEEKRSMNSQLLKYLTFVIENINIKNWAPQ